MATPLGHGLIGLALGRTLRPTGSLGDSRRRYAFAALAAMAADLDFLPGLLIGDINRFHQFASHSFAAAIVCGVVVGLLAPRGLKERIRLAVTGTVLYASHLVLDFFNRDIRAPFGQPLFWPISDHHYHAGVTVFGGVLHGDPGQPLVVFMRELLSWHNVRTVCVEGLVLSPIVVVAWYWSRRRSTGVVAPVTARERRGTQ